MRLVALDITVSMAGRKILDQVNLTVGQGELVGIVGPNGSGKTTLMRVLAHLLQPDNGEVRADGKFLNDYAPNDLARTIAYLAQGSFVHWSLNAEKIVALGRLPHRGGWYAGGVQNDPAIERAIAATEIGHLRHRTTDTLSGGERARVMLARALSVEAPILLADEPVASLDPYHQIQVMEVLAAAAKSGVAVVVILHDLTLAARYCDRLLMLKDGRVLAEGLPEHVLSDEHIKAAYRVTAHQGQHHGQTYIVPWERIVEK
ncbi:MAG: ABC transporter ATP-binding protein [Parvibaculaceae bacterium]